MSSDTIINKGIVSTKLDGFEIRDHFQVVDYRLKEVTYLDRVRTEFNLQELAEAGCEEVTF
jgi:hypothetical protein